MGAAAPSPGLPEATAEASHYLACPGCGKCMAEVLEAGGMVLRYRGRAYQIAPGGTLRSFHCDRCQKWYDANTAKIVPITAPVADAALTGQT